MIEIELLNPVIKDDTPEYEGPYTIEPSSQSSVVVPVQGKKMTQDLTVERVTLEELNVSVTQNGETRIEAEEGYFGLSGVNLAVDVELTEVPENDVEFIDYNGLIVYSYTVQEFLNLTELPANPKHSGLIAQGWNWTLTDAKEYVRNCGGLVIGQMYITNDGKTRIYITIDGHRSPYLFFARQGDAVIDWGDGNVETAPSTNSPFGGSAIQHTYADDGDYTVTITPAENGLIGFSTFSMGGNCSGIMCNNSSITANNALYYQTVNKIELGKNVSLSSHAFAYLFNCRSVTIPKGTRIEDPNKNSTGLIFANTTSLRGCVFPTEINTSTKVGFRTFQFSSITRVSFPSDFPTYTLRNIFESTRNIEKVYLPSAAPSDTYNPTDSVLQTNDYFYSALKKLGIPEGYTALGLNFAYCQSGLIEVVIPSTVLSISGGAFSGCRSLSRITFKPSTPPTLTASGVFNNLPTDCKIYVPQASLDAYKTATNYPNPNTYTYIGY